MGAADEDGPGFLGAAPPHLRTPNGGDDGESSEISRMIREEVRAVVRESMLATAAASTSASRTRTPIAEADSDPAPPSYDSAARLLASDAVQALATTDGSGGGDDVESCDQPGYRKKRGRLENFVRSVVVVAPLLIVVISLPASSLSGRDPLVLACLSFLLLMGTYFIGMGVAVAGVGIEAKFKKANASPVVDGAESTPSPKDDENKGFFGACFITYHMMIAHAFITLMLFWWVSQRTGALMPRFNLAARFDAKVPARHALAQLTACLERFTDRKATIADFQLCLSTMGLH